jgi:hypothetical protein
LGAKLIPADVIEALRTLGFPQDASFSEVQQQYQILSKLHHPDAGGDHQQFIQINAAYDSVIAWVKATVLIQLHKK